jgi:hypothetical protein
MADPTPEPTFWSQFWGRMKAVFKWMALHLAAPGAALVVVIVAVILVSMGAKNLQIGGLLARLFGKKDPEQRAIDVANSVDPDRVDKNGNLIQPGVPDSKGDTQVVVVPIKDPGLFSNPDTVTFIPPGKTEPIEVQLPDGVKARDVDKVIVVQPGKFVVTVKDESGVPAKKVDDLLAKYGS